ncbi:hypothetical protein ACKFKG_33155, partial [Phormidesmis sp. 146-35]
VDCSSGVIMKVVFLLLGQPFWGLPFFVDYFYSRESPTVAPPTNRCAPTAQLHSNRSSTLNGA